MKKTNIALIFVLLFFSCIKITYSQSRSFTGKPIYQILTKRAGVDLGTTTVELFPNIAPLAVQNFDSLVGVHFFDTTAFHRVIPGFMIQGGDPNSRHGDISTWGYGDPDQPTVEAEFSAARHLRGILSAARDADTNSATSQFFICVADASWLDHQYSIYGHVTSGMDIVDTIVNSPRDAEDHPLQKIEMFVTYTGSNDSVPLAASLISPVSGTMNAGFGQLLKWNAVSDAIIYRLEISTDPSFSTFFATYNLATTARYVSGLSIATTYYWRVRVNNGGHFSSYSDVWNFSTTGVGIQSYADVNTRIIVSPNPSNGEFNFSNIEKESSLEVFDITGRCIYQSVLKNTNETIDLTGKDKGVYFYRITRSKKQVQHGKIVLQ